MIYSVVKIQVKGLTFLWFGINPFTHLDKGGQNAHPKSPLFQKILENIFLETKKPPISLVIEVNRRRVCTGKLKLDTEGVKTVQDGV